MAPRTLAIAALAAIITTGAAHAQYYQPQFVPPLQYQPLQNATPNPPAFQPTYVPPPALPAPMPSPYRVIVPSYGGTSGYGR